MCTHSVGIQNSAESARMIVLVLNYTPHCCFVTDLFLEYNFLHISLERSINFLPFSVMMSHVTSQKQLKMGSMEANMYVTSSKF